MQPIANAPADLQRIRQGDIMLLVTFDSNVWRPVGDPARFPNDPMYASFQKVHEALRNGDIEGRLSETIQHAVRQLLISGHDRRSALRVFP